MQVKKNWLKWIYCPHQKFKQYFECDKKTKSKVFADRVCDGAPDCPGHEGFIEKLPVNRPKIGVLSRNFRMTDQTFPNFGRIRRLI